MLAYILSRGIRLQVCEWSYLDAPFKQYSCLILLKIAYPFFMHKLNNFVSLLNALAFFLKSINHNEKNKNEINIFNIVLETKQAPILK